MGIDEIEKINEELSLEEQPEQDLPITLQEVNEKFQDPVEVSCDEVVAYFENHQNENRICISVLVSNQEDDARQQELRLLSGNLRHAILKYLNLDRSTDIGANIEGIVGEATSDIGKHSVLGERFNKILALVTKDGLDISFHLVNPVGNDDPNPEDTDNPLDFYGKKAHGHNVAKGLEQDLIKQGCDVKLDKTHPVKNPDEQVIAFERDVAIKLPDKSE